MKARRLLSTLISMTAVVVALAVLAVPGQWPGIAQAIDLWGSGDDEQKDSSRDAFWTENGANEPIALKGMPSGFADLAEQVSPGVVNIQTSKTVSQQPLPRFLRLLCNGLPFLGPFGRDDRIDRGIA